MQIYNITFSGGPLYFLDIQHNQMRSSLLGHTVVLGYSEIESNFLHIVRSICPRSSYPIIVVYNIKWVTTERPRILSGTGYVFFLVQKQMCVFTYCILTFKVLFSISVYSRKKYSMSKKRCPFPCSECTMKIGIFLQCLKLNI